MSFLLSVLSLFQTVNTHVIWKNDVLTLPISSALHDYQYLPEASLFDDDGHEQIDPHRFYEYGVDRTFLSVVNTHVVRDYHIKYRVHFPTYQIISTKTIVFSVIDDVPPIILSIPSFRIPLNQKMPNLLEGIVYFDNYYDNEFLTVTVQSHQVVLNKVGIYEIIYQVTDQSGNKTAKTSYVEVYDHLPPDIIQKKDMVLSFGTSFLWQDYFTIKDNISLVLNIDINDALVDYTMLGTYPIEITATDESGLSSRTHQNLIIIDDKKPSIQLRSNPRDLSVNQDLDRAVFLEYVLAVSDNYDVLSVDELLISDDIEIDVPGDYFVYYTLIDRSGNIREEKLKIKVVDDIKPTIELIKPLVFEVFETQPFLDEYIYFYDNYTHEMDLVLKITSGLKMQTIGQYPVIFEVTDQANNKATLSTYVKIVDLTPPIILQQNDIIITDFSRKSLSHYFQVSDNYDVPSLVELYIDDSEVEYEKIGAYPLVVTATDSSGNLTFYESEIMVIDLIEPVISLTQTTLYLQVNQQEIDPADYLLYVHDNYDYLTEQDVIITHDIEYQKIGLYEIHYNVFDSSLNHHFEILYVVVDDHEPPFITGTHLILNAYDKFDPMEGLAYGDNLEHVTITHFPKIIDLSKPGSQIVTYVITDQRGNYSIFERSVTILPDQKPLDYLNFMPVVAVLILGALSVYYFWKKN